MQGSNPRQRWLARVQHDLVKRLLWVARDCRELGRQPLPGELYVSLFDDEGQPTDAPSLWARFCEDAPCGLGLQEFGAAIEQCIQAANHDDLPGVLALERAFECLKTAWHHP